MGVEEAAMPFERAKIVVYAKSLKRPVITDYLIVACCNEMGAFMT